jgi:hypothetical protein
MSIGLEWKQYKVSKGMNIIPGQGLCIRVGTCGVRVHHKNVAQLVRIRGMSWVCEHSDM